MKQGRLLIVAGSDSSGGAGLQADIKTAMLCGAYAMTAVTAVTVQNTQGVSAVHGIPPEIIAAQIDAVMQDIDADAVKTGMLGDVATIHAVADALRPYVQEGARALVVDPVMRAKGGAALLAEDAVDALRTALLPLATLITPNIPELEALSGKALETNKDVEAAALALAQHYGCAVLAKGGHMQGVDLIDRLVQPDGRVQIWQATRIDTQHTHGTGCTMASAIASGLALGQSLEDAITHAHALVRAGIEAAPHFGKGHGPLGHHLLRAAFKA